VAHFDNSPGNKYNPDPTKDVKWGDQTWEEMMIGFWGSVVDAPVAAQREKAVEVPGAMHHLDARRAFTRASGFVPTAKCLMLRRRSSVYSKSG
jgi:hypothetical protein